MRRFDEGLVQFQQGRTHTTKTCQTDEEDDGGEEGDMKGYLLVMGRILRTRERSGVLLFHTNRRRVSGIARISKNVPETL